jgi:hypothetical protein
VGKDFVAGTVMVAWVPHEHDAVTVARMNAIAIAIGSADDDFMSWTRQMAWTQ